MEPSDRKRILIVDDDQDHLASTIQILEKQGYEVRLHSQSIGTSQVVMKFRPDLILLDIKMPGVSGEELAGILKRNEIAKNIPIIFYSGLDEDSLYKLQREHGVAGFIQKGDPGVLTMYLSRFLSPPLNPKK
jgi:PleD family two-component response regulator